MPISVVGNAHAEPAFDSLVVLGDSNTDAGNRELAAEAQDMPSPTPSEAGYFEGRWSNGPTLADQLSLALSGDTTVPSLAGGQNYGFGGATAETDSSVAVPGIFAPFPDLPQQVDQYLDAGVQPDALHMVAFGNNDAFPGVLELASPQEVIGTTSAAIERELTRLRDAGAQYFVVVTNQNVGFSPIVHGGNLEQTAAALDPLVEGIKDGILSATGNAVNGRTDAEAYVFDVDIVLEQIIANPTAYGLPPEALPVPCTTVPGAAPECNGYFAFDTIHPTETVYAVAGNELSVAVQDQYAAPRSVGAFAETSVFSAWDMLQRAEALVPRDGQAGTRLVGDISYGSLDRDVDETSLGYDSSGTSLMGGIAFSAGGSLSVAGGLGYETGETDGTGNVFDFDREAIRGFAALAWQNGGLDVTAAVTGGDESIDDYRRVLSEGRVAQAGTDGESLAASAEVGYGFALGGAELRSFARAGYLETSLDGYQETGADGLMNLNSTISNIEANATLLGGGLELSKDIPVGGWIYSPRLSATYTHFADDFGHTVTAGLVDYAQVTRSVAINGLGDESVKLEAGIDAAKAGRSMFGIWGSWRGAMDGAEQVSAGGRLRINF